MNNIGKRTMPCAFACLLFITTTAQAAETEKHEGKTTGKLDTTTNEKAVGKAGELKDDVYKISLPRKDLAISVKGVKVKPGLALGSWIAFKESGNEAVMDGD